MQALEKDHRGFPIPFIVMRDPAGKPLFTVNDSRKVNEVVKTLSCAICGEPLGDDMWVAGGPMSAFHPHGAYIDTPIHHECGQYALQVCPYLAVSAYSGKADVDKLNDKFGSDTVIFVDPTVLADRPPMFVFAKISGYSRDNGYVHPHKPFLDIEFWNEGVKLTEEQGRDILKKHYS